MYNTAVGEMQWFDIMLLENTYANSSSPFSLVSSSNTAPILYSVLETHLFHKTFPTVNFQTRGNTSTDSRTFSGFLLRFRFFLALAIRQVSGVR